MQPGWLKLLFKELTDKWQIPTLLIAVVLAATAAYRVLGNYKQNTTQEYITLSETLLAKEDYTNAGKLASKLLEDPELKPEQKAKLYGVLARVIHDTELPLKVHSEQRLQAFHKYFDQSILGKRPLTADEHLMLANVFEWENKCQVAIEHIDWAMDMGAGNQLDLIKRKLELLPRTGRDIDDLFEQTLSQLMSRTDLSEDDLVWSLGLKTERLFKEGEFTKAIDLISQTLPRIKEEKNHLSLAYSLALGQYYQNQPDLAEPTLRTILNQLPSRDELGAKVLLLLGRICLEDRPEEAESYFDTLISAFPHTPYQLAGLVGKAQCCAIMFRFTDSTLGYQHSFDLLDEIGPNHQISKNDINRSLEKASEYLSKNNHLTQAVSLAKLEFDHLDADDDQARSMMLIRLGTWHRQLAVQQSERLQRVGSQEIAENLKQQIKDNYRLSGDYLSKLSLSSVIMDRQAAQILWQAAACYEKAELPDESQRILELFVKKWPNDTLIPEALFKLAKIYQNKNDFLSAEVNYKTLIADFHRTPVGLQSPVALAECYFSMGSNYYSQAEEVLREMVEDTSNQKLYTPESMEFRKAMFLLGKVYYFTGQYDRCVARLEEALERDSGNRASAEAVFLIAQSYRKISEENFKKISQTNNRSLKNTLTLARQENLKRAKDLYMDSIASLEKFPSRSTLENNYLQQAYVYRADCLFDLGQYLQAIKAYEQVIDHYEKTSSALASYVQIANAYQRLGQYGKIKAVLERMKWLVQQLPNEAFAKSGKPFSREDWQEWIDWNYRSGLLDYQPEYLARTPGDPANF
jgi:tetratricopeptide (TPR) repeat protein